MASWVVPAYPRRWSRCICLERTIHLVIVQTGWLAGWLQTTGGAVDVSSGSLTSDCLEGQQLDVFPTRVGRAVVLAQSTAVFLVGALHLLHHLGLWQERRGGRRKGELGGGGRMGGGGDECGVNKVCRGFQSHNRPGEEWQPSSDSRATLLQEIQPPSSC